MDPSLVKLDVNVSPQIVNTSHETKKNPLEFVKRNILRIKPKIKLAVLAELHYQAIHGIRKFMVNGNLLSECECGQDTEPFEKLANDCRNAFAIAIGQNKNRQKIHCAIKLYKGTQKLPRGDWIVWTLARSELLTSQPFTLRNNFGPEEGQEAKNNSAYAALTGCSDGQTEWGARAQVYPCFYCNDLRTHEKYVNYRKDWQDYYKTALVFPLRWIKNQESKIEIKGFLSFDSDVPNILDDGLACIYKADITEYWKSLINSTAYHAGGIIADVLATTINLQDKIEKK